MGERAARRRHHFVGDLSSEPTTGVEFDGFSDKWVNLVAFQSFCVLDRSFSSDDSTKMGRKLARSSFG